VAQKKEGEEGQKRYVNDTENKKPKSQARIVETIKAKPIGRA